MTSTTKNTVAVANELRRLLRGEIAAAETYAQALEAADESDARILGPLQDDHGRAIKFLAEQVSAHGQDPTTSSGVWGGFARAVEGGAKLLGMKVALTALREGERAGLADYEDALRTGELPELCRHRIESEFVPAQRQHIEALDRLIASK